jgi:hypothetical protein
MTQDFTETRQWLENLLRSWNKKSIRTTFKSSDEASRMLAKLTEEDGTVKNLFTRYSLLLLIAQDNETDPLAQKLNDKNARADLEKVHRTVRKTYVLSEGVLKTLAESAKHFGLPRDLLFEFGIRYLHEDSEKRRQETLEKHKQYFGILNAKWTDLEVISQEMRSTLDDKDPLYGWFTEICIRFEELCSALEDEVKEGQPIEYRW